MRRVLPLILLISMSTEASEFSDLFIKIKNRAPYLKASEKDLSVAEIALKRSSRHYLPKAYLQSSTYNTDDAGSSFFGNLNQRAVNQSDFNPSTLNEPERKTFTSSHVGINLPIYEGGMKENAKDAKAEVWNAKKEERNYTERELYSKTATLYGTILTLKEDRASLMAMLDEISKILGSYTIGSKENPLGHSGLLGLKGLKLRVEGELEKNSAKTKAILSILEILAGEKIDISETKLTSFLSEINKSDSSESYKSKSLDYYAKSLGFAKNAEKAHFLPQISLFADRSFNHGDRDTAGATTVGITLNWEIFNGENIGAIAEASERAYQMKYMQTANLENESMKRIENLSKIEAVDSNLLRLKEAHENLTEQSAITTRLFKNGIVNVLQLIEVLNRRVDVILYLCEAKNEKLNSLSELYLLSSN